MKRVHLKVVLEVVVDAQDDANVADRLLDDQVRFVEDTLDEVGEVIFTEIKDVEVTSSGVVEPNTPYISDGLSTVKAKSGCARCGCKILFGRCTDGTCPFSDYAQDDKRGWSGHPGRDPRPYDDE